MQDITNPDDVNTTSFKRFVALSSGEFWRALQDGHDGKVVTGQILMIAQIDEVDGELHTVRVRLHPSNVTQWKKEVKYLVDEFLEQFEYVDKVEAERIREQEIKAIQQRISESQTELQEACSDIGLMDKLIEKETPPSADHAALPVKYEAVGADVVGAIRTQKVTALMAQGLTETGVEQIKAGMEQQKHIAERRSEWIAKRTSLLTEIASEMTPFFEEKAALALALTKEMTDHVDSLMKGIGNLNLYVLKNVEVTTLKEGVSADPELKLTICQRVLYMDEELAVWADVDDQWDYKNEKQFLDVLASNQNLVKQIFPNERCVVSIAATRKNHNYVDRGYHYTEAQLMELENQRQFLLVRDGENLHLVLSPELFHNYSQSLFPTTDETEAPFKGINGEDITYRDLDYTDSLKEHDRIALGYKRLLILLCGLDHNKRLFGEFYKGEPSLMFISLPFQEKHFNLIHDVDGRGLITTYRPSLVEDWAKELNKEIGSGSRVLVQWRKAFSPDSIPGCFEKSSLYRDDHYRSQEFFPKEKGACVRGVVKKQAGRLILEVPVEGSYGYGEHRSFNAKLDLDYVLKNESTFAVLCIDRLNPDDAKWYLHDRPSRNLNTTGIRMLKQAIEWAEREREETKEVRQALLDSVLDAGVVGHESEGVRLVDDAVAKWMCAHPSKDLNSLLTNTRAFNALCDQIYQLSNKGLDITQDLIEAEEELGKTVVRVSILANGNFAAYSTPLPEDRDDRLTPFYWLERTTYKMLKKGIKADSKKFVILCEYANDETVTFQREDLNEYIPKYTPFKTPTAKAKALDSMGDFGAHYLSLVRMKDNEQDIKDFIKGFVDTRQWLTSKAGNDYVVSPDAILPIGHMLYHDKYARFGLAGGTDEVIAWLVADNQALTQSAINHYAYTYARKDSARSRMATLIESSKGKELYEVLTLKQLPAKAKLDLFAAPSIDAYSVLPKDEIFDYSYQRKIDKQKKAGYSIYVNKEEYSDLDKFFNIEKPADFRPVLVYEDNSGTWEEREIHIFELDEELLEEHGNALTIFSSLDKVKKKHGTFEYTNHRNGEKYEIVLKWTPIDKVEIFGARPIASYGYKVASKTNVQN